MISNGTLSHLPTKLWLRTKALGEPKGKSFIKVGSYIILTARKKEQTQKLSIQYG